MAVGWMDGQGGWIVVIGGWVRLPRPGPCANLIHPRAVSRQKGPLATGTKPALVRAAARFLSNPLFSFFVFSLLQSAYSVLLVCLKPVVLVLYNRTQCRTVLSANAYLIPSHGLCLNSLLKPFP